MTAAQPTLLQRFLLFKTCWPSGPARRFGPLDRFRSALHTRHALSLQSNARHAEAIDHLTLALHLAPHNIMAYFFRASCHTALDQLPQAIADYTTLIDAASHIPLFYYARAKLHYKHGDRSLALADIARARTLPMDRDSRRRNEEAWRHLLATSD